MIQTYEVEWRGSAEGDGEWGVVEVGKGRNRIYILLNGQTFKDASQMEKVSPIDKGGKIRTLQDGVLVQNSCELIRRYIKSYLEGKKDRRMVVGMW